MPYVTVATGRYRLTIPSRVDLEIDGASLWVRRDTARPRLYQALQVREPFNADQPIVHVGRLPPRASVGRSASRVKLQGLRLRSAAPCGAWSSMATSHAKVSRATALWKPTVQASPTPCS